MIDNIFNKFRSFALEHKILGSLTLGAALCFAIGMISGRSVAWLNSYFGTAKKVSDLSQKTTTFPKKSSSDEVTIKPTSTLSNKSADSFKAAIVQATSVISDFTISNKSSTPIERAYPPVGAFDTVSWTFDDKGKMIFASAHGQGLSFEDDEIQAIHHVIRTKFLEGRSINDKVLIKYTKNNKAIIQQQATRGCTAAVAAMLILDNGGTYGANNLRNCNLGDDDNMIRDIQRANFTPVKTDVAKGDLDALDQLIKQNGSAIVTVQSGIGGHVVVVDEITSEKVRLRDPYHGWEIDVNREAFKISFSGNTVIQIEAKPKYE